MNDDLQTLDDCFAQMSEDLSLIADLVHAEQHQSSSPDHYAPWQPTTSRGHAVWGTVHYFAPIEQL
jgi:hypothetical protein